MAPRGSDHHRFQAGARALIYASPIYRWMALAGRPPQSLTIVPADHWPGHAEDGAELLNNSFRFAGQSFQGEVPPWMPPGASAAWLAEMHGFDWLRHLRVIGGDAARRQARVAVSHWLDHCGRWTPVAWAPDVLGARIAAWIGQHDFFLASADDALRARVFDSLARQVRHLYRTLPGRLRGAALIQGIRGLTYGGLCLPGLDKAAERAAWLLARELPRQILPDGGQVERSPSVQLQVLRHLIDIRACFRAARADVPEALQHAIDRLAPSLRFFRHGDGGLALFNGGREDEPIMIDTVLALADARGRPLKSAPHIGFERLTAGRTCLILDAGAPPAPGMDDRAHAGTLSFEMSVGRERLIVNCGAHPAEHGLWRAALAATAAHSTLTLADTNSAAVREEGGLGRRPRKVDVHRQDTREGILVEAVHDGYREPLGALHRRRLYLAETGEDLRGEDSITAPAGLEFAVRFHLHPSVQAHPAPDGNGALLHLPSGAVWQLRTSGAVEIADSIYLGTGTEPIPTAQLVIRGVTGPDSTTIKWAFRRDKALPADSAPDSHDTVPADAPLSEG